MYLDTQIAEWFAPQSDGSVVHGSVPIEEATSAEVARAANEAVTAAGSSNQACVLALGPGFVEQRLLTLPELNSKALKSVLLRKAAAHLKTTPEDTLFSAREFGEADESKGEGQGNQRQWLLMAMRRTVVQELRAELRSSGFAVKRVVAARMSGPQAVHTNLDSEGEACIAIAVEPGVVTVSLIANDALQNQNVLHGDLENNAQLASVLIQEVRSYEAYWRKQRRGEGISSVGIVGLGQERGELLCAAVKAAVPHANVQLVLGEFDLPNAGRCQSLAACLERGPLSPDLTVPIPPTMLARALILFAFAAITLGAGVVTHGRMSDDLDSVNRDLGRLEDSSRGLDEVELKLEAARSDEARVEEAVESILTMSSAGIPLAETLGTVFEGFQSRATMLAMTISGNDSGGQIAISGATDGNPLRAYAALEQIRTTLEGSSFFEEVTCTPGGRLPGVGDSKNSQRLDFKVEAKRGDSE